MIKINYKSRTIAMCSFFVMLFSCDKDVSDVGGEVLTGTDIVRTQLSDFAIQTENISLNSIQTNNFNNARFLGSSTTSSGSVDYNLLYRVEPTTSNALTEVVAGKTINTIKIKSANLIIPYTYTLLETSNDSVSKYQITNIVNEGQALDFDVMVSGIDLVLAENSSSAQKLYFANGSDINGPFSVNIGNGDSIVEAIVDANPNSNEFEVTTAIRNDDRIFTAVSADIVSNAFEDLGKTLRVNLQKDFLGEAFADANEIVTDPSIFSSSSFLDNFKGVYLKLNESNANLVSLFDNSVTQILPKIEITFETESDFAEISNSDGTVTQAERFNVVEEVTLDFNMNAQTVGIINTQNSPEFDSAFSGDENMLIKSGVSVSRINLFEDTSQLNDLFERNPIVNSATLKVYVDTDSELYNETIVPQNLWINDLNTGNLISGAELNITNPGAPFYEFTVTQYLRRILNVSNVSALPGVELDLVLSVSTSTINVEVISQGQVVNDAQSLLIFNSDEEIRTNIGSLVSTNEVPLFGNGAADQSKRPQLLVNFSTID